MSNYRKPALSAIESLVAAAGSSLADNDLKIFIQKPEEEEQQSKRLDEIYKAMFKGFFHCAAKGLAFVPETKVANRFGRSLKENYPEASESFLKFAKTYWTLRVLEFDLMDYDWEWIGAHLLAKLEQDIGPVFFPSPGLHKISPTQREEFQRELISISGADINIDEFMTGNPILIRGRWLENLLPKIKEMALKQIERNKETEAVLERMKIEVTGSDMVGQEDESLYTGEVEVVLGLSADADILAKLSLFLVHTPEIKIKPTVGSSDRRAIIAMELDKPLPLVEMLSLQIPEAQVTGEPWSANDKKRKARRITIALKEAEIIPTKDS